MLRTSLPIVILLALYGFVAKHIVIDSWLKLIAVAGACGVIGYPLAGIIAIPIKEIKPILGKVKRKLLRK